MTSSADQDIPRAPGTLMLHLLGKCNLQCVHCYMEGAPSRREQLALDAVIAAIGECPVIGIGQIYFTGGEPLLYTGLHEALRAAAVLPGLSITVCTNGTVITRRHVSALRDVRARAHVSVDGPASFHDEFRRLDGAWQATERGVRALTEAGVPVTIVSTISRANLSVLRFLADWALDIGADQLRVQPLLDLGRGQQISDQRLTPAELDRLLLQLSDFANTYGRQGLECSIIGVTRRFLLAHPCGADVCNGAGCHRRVAREIKKVVVREDGTVLPEVTNLNHSFAIGNLHEDSLTAQIVRYFESGYERFDRLCRTTYADVVPTWPAALVPWDQILAARSHVWRDDAEMTCGHDPVSCSRACS
jgi:Fe-coproporphyrin III synthase